MTAYKSQQRLLMIVLTICIIFTFQFAIERKWLDISSAIHSKLRHQAHPPGKFIWSNYNLSKIPDRTSSKYKEDETSNYPIEYDNQNLPSGNCGRIPELMDVEFINTHWQVLNHSNGTFSLLNAYYDNRIALDSPTIRIAVAVRRVRPKHKIICQLWFDDALDPVLSPIYEYRYLWWEEWGLQYELDHHSYVIACKVPDKHKQKVPRAVSLVEEPCDFATNLLKVYNNRPTDGVKKKFAVCMKHLNFLRQDNSVGLVEWLEVLFSMGVEKVCLYNLAAHPNMVKVLQYYEEQGKVELRPMSLPGLQPNHPSFYKRYFKNHLDRQLLFETILYNDCFYRNMYQFDWISAIDIDELIMPVGAPTKWDNVLQKIAGNDQYDGLAFSNIYFFDNNTYFNVNHKNVAPFLPFSNLVHRAKKHNPVGDSSKSWFNTEKVVTLHNHYGISCFRKDGCKWFEVSPQIAQLQHYCFNKKDQKCCTTFENNTVIDTNIWKYKHEITKETLRTLEQLGFIEENF